ncbi:MAG: DUF5655 domain-containing protein [Undibacterium umbellatum]|uniref:DUF5655 domain-containing protein n=1 Tax=Undibacterium umbellatum TaxID=2762300 RepID=UPI003BB56FFB
MSEISLFRLSDGKATMLQGDASGLERPLQTLIESNLTNLLRIRFLASEYSTGKTHGGRIDTLGLDENACPVILEYKRSVSENVINQGLYYLDWLMDHQAEFQLLVAKKLGEAAAASIDWSAPRLVCIAADFTKFDAHAVQQIDRNIELIRYRLFGEDLLLLEQANGGSNPTPKTINKSVSEVSPANRPRSGDKSYAEWLHELSPHLRELLTTVEDFIASLGDDVERKELKLYAAFKRLKNFATVVLQKNRIVLYLHLDPEQFAVMPANCRNVSNSGHWGTGDLEVSVSNGDDFENAKSLILQAYEGRVTTPF